MQHLPPDTRVRRPFPLRAIVAPFAALTLFAAACGTDEDASGDQTTSETTDSSTTTDRPSTTTDGSDQPTSTDNASTSTSEPSSPAIELTESCPSTEGFSISYPEDWSTNDSNIVAPCTMFDPEPFEVQDGTDARFAAINAYVDQVPFTDALPASDDRSVTAIDGHQAVRVDGAADGQGLYDDGTRYTRYLVDVEDQQTLILDLIDVGLDDGAFEQLRPTLDRMARSLTIEGQTSGDSVVARFSGGGAPFSVTATPDDDQLCLETAPEGDEYCFAAPAPDGVGFAAVDGSAIDAVIGVAGNEVFRIVATLDDDEEMAVLPVRATDTGIGGWALPIAAQRVTALTWFDLAGNQLESADMPNSGDQVDAIASFGTEPVTANDFPLGGPPTFLADVRLGGHDDFDRVTFVLDGPPADISYRVQTVEEAIPPSGQPVEVDGVGIIEVTMTPVTGVDLSGPEPVVEYDGPQRLAAAATDVITEVIAVEDFESTFVWAIGVDTDAQFAVALLDEPTRLVVDVAAEFLASGS